VTLAGALGPLAERDFRFLFLGRTISLLGNAVAPVALAFAVLDDLDGSATELGLVLAAIWVPQILFILIGGVWADRLPRHLVMVGTDLIMFATQASVAALLLAERAELWHLVVLQVVRGVATAFFFPASTGLVPQLVSAPSLQQANALLLLSQSSMGILGAASAGVVVAAAGAGWALAFDAATFLASAALLVRIRLPRGARMQGSDIVRELREGWDEFRSRTWLWAIVVSAALGNFAIQVGVTVLGPVVADRELGGATAWGLIVSGEAAGFLVAGLVALRFRPERPLLVGCLALLLHVPLVAAIAVPAPVALIVAVGVAGGFGIQLFNVLWVTTLQQHIPQDHLSRVSAYDLLGSFIAIPIGLTIAGPLSDVIGVHATIWAAGGLLLAATLPLLALPDVRRLRRLESQPEAAIAAS
jgi:predicted MFS family arabinose efflux permease